MRRRGLSAIELATVVALIAIIVSLALPAANATRASGEADLARMSLVAFDDQLRHLATTRPIDLDDPADVAQQAGSAHAYTIAVAQPDGSVASTDPAALVVDTVVPNLGDPGVLVVAAAASDSCWLLRHEPDTRSRFARVNHDGDAICQPNLISPDGITGNRRNPTVHYLEEQP